MKIKYLIATLFILTAIASNTYAATAANEADMPVLHIQASRFVFTPSQISVKTGQTVLLEIEALDRQHGFSIPELGVRVDVIPGQKVVLKITPTKSGRLVFYCDIFCGSGHEQMAGEIVVES
ncbi:cupredoxin domain-containing protein [Methylomonas sp. AM2-LC]|uniref:cupredoxin domain-containing protein n=1 Tax=Methylomonas sp. AM2-LC TaxID=3153301 RepID=UPI0032658859